MSVTSQYLDVHDQPTLLIPFLTNVQQETHALASDQVGSLASYLLADLDTKPHKQEWDEQVITSALLTLKHLGRRVDDCDMLYKKQGIDILIKLTGLGVPPEYSLVDTSSSQAALKCLANCILLSSASAPREDGGMIIAWLVESKHTLATCARLLKSDQVSTDIQFLICRLLYLMTTEGTCMMETLMSLDLPGHLEKVLSRHVQQWLVHPTSPSTEKHPSTILVCEVLKLQTNLMLSLQEMSSSGTNDDTTKEQVGNRFFNNLIPILDILFILPYPAPLPLVATAPLTHALQVFLLYNADTIRQAWSQSSRLTEKCPSPKQAFCFCVLQLKSILASTLIYLMPPRPASLPPPSTTQSTTTASSGWQPRQTSDTDLDRDLAIVISLLMTTLEYADEVQEPDMIHQVLIPKPKGDDADMDPALRLIFSRLVKLLSSTRFPRAKEVVTEWLYSHVNEDPKAFIDLVGYDNAKHTSIGKDYKMQEDDYKVTKDSNLAAQDEAFTELSDLTDEEKERQAERLFVMFEKIQLKD